MSMQDPLADMFTRIRNAHLVYKRKVRIPYSHIKESIAQVLQNEGFIRSYDVKGEGANKRLMIILKYYRAKPVIEEIKRVSRPGLRRYFRVAELPRVRSGLGICILSTSRGILTDKQAREQQVGGELICTVF